MQSNEIQQLIQTVGVPAAMLAVLLVFGARYLHMQSQRDIQREREAREREDAFHARIQELHRFVASELIAVVKANTEAIQWIKSYVQQDRKTNH
jgi:hypothetical protein